MEGIKRTPIFPAYAGKAKCIDFAGWEMPVQFSRIQDEHAAVRNRVGLFDVSHMGELEVSGSQAEVFLQQITTNDVSKLAIHQAQYTVMCQDDGGTLDDLLIYRMDVERYLLVVNAANTEKDEQWLRKHVLPEVTIQNRSDQIALLALQGPQAKSVLRQVVPCDLAQILPFTFQVDVLLWGVPVMISRTGYTGEDGFELYVPAEEAVQIWEGLLQLGTALDILPCGLGARDTLRFEAGFPLYGQELAETITPLEAGLGFVIKFDKGPFIGRETLWKQKEEGVPRSLVGLEMVERGIPRSGYTVFADGVPIGQVTTGTRSPTLQKDIALALIKTEYAKTESLVEVEIRGKKRKAEIIPTPFYRRG